MYSFTEENYLKTIYHLQERSKDIINTNSIAEIMETKPASVTEMLKKLNAKKLIKYQKYKGVELTGSGKKVALETVRKHRLWETFLYDKLKFNWDEVHEIAEQLEHIKSDRLTDKLDAFLGYPTHDPHGDPIPNKNGKFNQTTFTTIFDADTDKSYTICGVCDHSAGFLKHLNDLEIAIGLKISILKKNDYDQSVEVNINKKVKILTYKTAKNLLIK